MSIIIRAKTSIFMSFYVLFCSAICFANSQLKTQSHLISKPNNCSYTPWFAGTLLEFSSTNQDPGSVNLQPYFFNTLYYGDYDNNWSMSSMKNYYQLIESIYGEIGITKRFQIEFNIQTQSTFFDNKVSSHFGDLSLKAGLQFLWDEKGKAQPNLRLIIAETFPTGSYQMLDPYFSGRDASGQGAYSTLITLLASKILYTIPCHAIYTNASLSFGYVSPVKIKGVSTYGGDSLTRGKLDQRFFWQADFSFEYSLTQNWVFACDFIFSNLLKTTFHGEENSLDRMQNSVSTLSTNLFTITPAIEYNFNADLGLIIGSTFSVIGQNTNAFIQPIISITYTF